MIIKRTSYIVEFDGDPFTVLRWLISEMTDDIWKLTPSNHSAKNDEGKLRWSLSSKKKNYKARFTDIADAQVFALVWGEKWDFSEQQEIR